MKVYLQRFQKLRDLAHTNAVLEAKEEQTAHDETLEPGTPCFGFLPR